MSEQDLEEWLEDIKKRKAGTIDYSFPNDALKNDYIATIAQRTDDEVTDLLRKFLIPSGSLGSDQSSFLWLIRSIKNGEPIVRGLLGVVSDSKAINGVCVTPPTMRRGN